MKNLDFTDKKPNEILGELSAITLWLAEQYKLGTRALPPEMIAGAFQSNDSLKTFFLNSGTQHLPVMAASVEAMKEQEAVILPPMPVLPIQDTSSDTLIIDVDSVKTNV